MNMPNGLKRKLSVWYVLILLLSASLFSVWATANFLPNGRVHAASSLRVEIQPQNAKFSVGEEATFWAIIYNGTPSYTVGWYCNNSCVGSGQSVTFVPFNESAISKTVMVYVTDSVGNSGWATTSVYDPAAISLYLMDFPATATYTIETDDGTNIWSTRGDGYKAYESTNASYVFSATRDALTGSNPSSVIGGKIVVGHGTYTINNNITLTYPQITIEGENFYEPTLQAGSDNVTIFDVQRFAAGGEANYGIQIKNLFLHGTVSGTRPLIVFNDTQLCSVQDCFIEKHAYGIWVNASEDDWFVNNHFEAQTNAAIEFYNNVRRCRLEGGDSYQGQYGIVLTSFAGGTRPYANTITNFNARVASDTGFFVNGHHNLISVCLADMCGTYGMVVQGSNNIISICWSGNSAGSTQNYGIYISSGASDNIVTSVQALSNADVDIFNGGTNSRINLCYNGTTWIP
jgi:hypothetical protein